MKAFWPVVLSLNLFSCSTLLKICDGDPSRKEKVIGCRRWQARVKSGWVAYPFTAWTHVRDQSYHFYSCAYLVPITAVTQALSVWRPEALLQQVLVVRTSCSFMSWRTNRNEWMWIWLTSRLKKYSIRIHSGLNTKLLCHWIRFQSVENVERWKNIALGVARNLCYKKWRFYGLCNDRSNALYSIMYTNIRCRQTNHDRGMRDVWYRPADVHPFSNSSVVHRQDCIAVRCNASWNALYRYSQACTVR